MSGALFAFAVITAVPAAVARNEWRYAFGLCSATWSGLSIVVGSL